MTFVVFHARLTSYRNFEKSVGIFTVAREYFTPRKMDSKSTRKFPGKILALILKKE